MNRGDWDAAFAPAAGADRRVHTRRVLQTAATLRIPGGKTVEVRTLDISAGGMAILVPSGPPTGATFTVCTALPMKAKPHAPIEVRAQVMHSVYSGALGGFKVGLRFIDLGDDTLATIEAFL